MSGNLERGIIWEEDEVVVVATRTIPSKNGKPFNPIIFGGTVLDVTKILPLYDASRFAVVAPNLVEWKQ